MLFFVNLFLMRKHDIFVTPVCQASSAGDPALHSMSMVAPQSAIAFNMFNESVDLQQAGPGRRSKYCTSADKVRKKATCYCKEITFENLINVVDTLCDTYRHLSHGCHLSTKGFFY